MLSDKHRWAVMACGVALSGLVAACGGDDGGAGTTPPSGSGPSPLPGAASRIVYLADQDLDGVNELYLAGSGIKLNPPLSAGRSVGDDYKILPDRSGVVYRADQDADDVFELYLVKFSNPGVSTKLNPAFAGEQDLAGFAPTFDVLPDGSGVVYRADQDADEVVELYWAKFDSPGVSTKLNPGLVAGGDIESFQILANGRGVLYLADQDIDDKRELYLVQVAVPGTSQKLNSSLADDRAVVTFAPTPDSTSVVYQADGDSNDVYELYRVLLANPGISTKLNGTFPGSGNPGFGYAITADGSSVVYTGPGDPGPGQDLYRATFANPGVNTKLNAANTGGAVLSFQVLPDSSGVVYALVQGTVPQQVANLFLVKFGAPGSAILLSNPTLGERRFSPLFTLAPDSKSVAYAVYLGGAQTGAELRRADLDNPGSTTLLQGPLLSFVFQPSGGVALAEMAITPDSKGLLYIGHEVTGVDELFRVEFAAPTSGAKLSGALVNNGDVQSFVVR